MVKKIGQMNDKGSKWELSLKNLVVPLFLMALFWGLAVLFTVMTGSLFALFNFGYIGTSVAAGVFLIQALPKKYKTWGRRISQILVGCYMLFFLGFVGRENMQIEGFFMLLMAGVFVAATVHYLIAKIAGPLIFGRAWCSYACWTAMVLDLLPFKRPQHKRIRYLGMVRYFHFFLSLGLVLFIWYVLKNPVEHQSTRELFWLITGNVIYYALGIILAYRLKDNRAFCKYICPIPVLQKITSGFSLLKIKIDPAKCVNCGKCEKVCPMDIKLLVYKNKNQRILSTECILCSTCAYECPYNAVSTSFGLDFPRLRQEVNN